MKVALNTNQSLQGKNLSVVHLKVFFPVHKGSTQLADTEIIYKNGHCSVISKTNLS